MSIRRLGAALALAVLSAAPVLSAGAARAEVPSVVASIRPVHSLVAAVMAGVGEPRLLVDGAQSPHSYTLRPSDAGALSEADVVFWIGPHYEAFLTDALPSLAPDAARIALEEADGVVHLPNREGGAFEPHEDHHESGEAEAEGHDHADAAGGQDDDHGHGHDEAAGGHDHDHGAEDPHVWLSPENGIAITRAIAAELSAIDPANAAAYAANAQAEAARIEAAAAEAGAILAPDRGRDFVVTHDGFQYFEAAFGPRAVASVTISPDVSPSAGRVAEVQERIAATGTRCLVSEPQFPAALMDLFVTEGSRSASLDYIGIDHEPGPDLYTDMMVENARRLHDCLSGG